MKSTAKEFQKPGLSIKCIPSSNKNKNFQDKSIQFLNMKTTLEYSWYRLNGLLLSILSIGRYQILEFAKMRILKF